jgi:hypothetical protein
VKIVFCEPLKAKNMARFRLCCLARIHQYWGRASAWGGLLIAMDRPSEGELYLR